MELKKLYEDGDVEVYKAPTEEELEQIIKDAIKKAGRPLVWKELRELFAGVAGEDRLRKVLIRMIERDELIELPDGALALPGMEYDYVPRKSTKRVRPLVPIKFRERWGSLASRLRRMGIPLGEALKLLSSRAEWYGAPFEGLEELEEDEYEEE